MEPVDIQYAALAARHLVLPLSLLALAGCATTSPITANDTNVSLPSFRVGVGIDERQQAAAEPRTGKSIEFGLTRAKGSADQTLATGRSPIIYNETTFSAPNQLRNDFDINYADLSFKWRKFFGERSLGLELSGGIGYTSIGLTVSSATAESSARFSDYGAQGGVGLIWRIRPSTSLHAHLSAFVSEANRGISDMGRYELFLSQGLGENIALHVGYAKWEVNGASGLGASDFRMTFNGPTLELGLNY